MLTPMMPSGAISRAFFSSFVRARQFALKLLLKKSGSLKPGCAAEMMPTPPSFATAPRQSGKADADAHPALDDGMASSEIADFEFWKVHYKSPL